MGIRRPDYNRRVVDALRALGPDDLRTCEALGFPIDGDAELTPPSP